MSRDETSLPALTNSLSEGLGAQAALPGDVGEITVRWQAQEIIDVLLAESDPQSEWTRARLRDLVVAYPDDPERALLEHLTVTTALTNGEGGVKERPSASPVATPAPVPFTRRSRNKIEAVLGDKMLMTAFQPVRQLPEGHLIGVEALTRFVSDDGASADHWFSEAESVGLGADLEIAALLRALTAAQSVPEHLFIALNLTPATCLDPRIQGLLEHSQLAMDRIIVELTGQVPLDQYDSLAAGLAPLRQRGLRLAVDGGGAGFTSMDQVLVLRPDVIKLDRRFIEDIDTSEGQLLRVAAMAELARSIDAELAAEGVETDAELAAVTALGMTAAQGYLLGRPSVHPLDWNGWIRSESETAASGPAS
jgi:EAL domain-containing protein (putative c-di-GMP-specific phosphodiesterase class I)